MPIDKQEVLDIVEELRLAMIESIAAERSEFRAKFRREKARKRLLLAKDALRAVTFN